MIKKITVHNLEIGSLASGFLIKSLGGFGMPKLNTEMRSRGHYHGSTAGYSYYEGRILSIEGQIIGSSPADYQDKRKKLAENLDAMRGLQYVYFELQDGTILRVNAVLAKEVEEPYRAGNMVFGDFSFQLATENHYFEAVEAESGNINVYEGGGFDIPFDLPMDMDTELGESSLVIQNDGNGYAFPTLTLRGEMSDPTITNRSTGEAISLNYDLIDTDEVVFDIYNRVVLLNGSTNITEFVSGDWLTLQSGVNEIVLTAGSYTPEAELEITWRATYITI